MVCSRMTANILLVDDSSDFRDVLTQYAKQAKCNVKTAETLEEARRLVSSETYDLIMLDLQLPDGDGLSLLDDIDVTEHGQIAVVTGFATVESAIRAVRSPVVDYLLKPVPNDMLAALMEKAQLHAQMHHSAATSELGGMLGQSPRIQALFEEIRRVAPLDVSVLVNGESGTGKELVARAVHELSGRKGKFVPVNCGAVAPELLSSHLFGHERGSFTGALQSHAGFFEQAQDGTLFLDEITEMPMALQVYLLRVLESGCVTRVGGTHEIPVDVRVIAATNRNPQQAINDGILRADLYYRLVGFPLNVPALRDRREDILLLAKHFLDRLNERYGTSRRFSSDALQRFLTHPWPGNVRELRHAVQRCYILAEGDEIDAQPERPSTISEGGSGFVRFHVGMTFDEIEREVLLKTLDYHDNNKRQAARTLGITTKTIYNRLLRYRELGLIGEGRLGPEDGETAQQDDVRSGST